MRPAFTLPPPPPNTHTFIQPSSDCNEPCTGASTEMCGAANRMNIIRANCSGNPFLQVIPTHTHTTQHTHSLSAHTWLLLHLASSGHACLSASMRELPFCNTSLSIGARLDDLIGRLSLHEKAGLIGPDPVTSPCAFLDYGVKRWERTFSAHAVTCDSVCLCFPPRFFVPQPHQPPPPPLLTQQHHLLLHAHMCVHGSQA